MSTQLKLPELQLPENLERSPDLHPSLDTRSAVTEANRCLCIPPPRRWPAPPIGGGNTAIDAANAARRLGAEEVHLFYRRTAGEMPAFPFEYERSLLEGVRLHWLAQPLQIAVKERRAAGARFLGKPGRGQYLRREAHGGAWKQEPFRRVAVPSRQCSRAGTEGLGNIHNIYYNYCMAAILVKDVPDELRNLFKALCAERGKTMREGIIELMREAVASRRGSRR